MSYVHTITLLNEDESTSYDPRSVDGTRFFLFDFRDYLILFDRPLLYSEITLLNTDVRFGMGTPVNPTGVLFPRVRRVGFPSTVSSPEWFMSLKG